MDRTISFDCDGNDITCMKVFDALAYPCSACDIEDCPDREIYKDDEEQRIKRDILRGKNKWNVNIETD